jgi:uncharacterized delta-60 repeat protein
MAAHAHSRFLRVPLQVESLEDRCLLSTFDLNNFQKPGDFLTAGHLEADSTAQQIVLVNSNNAPGQDALVAFDARTGQQVARFANPRGLDGFTTPYDRAFIGDVDGSGVERLILFNRVAHSGDVPTGAAINIYDIQDGVVDRLINYSDTVADTTYARLLQGMVDPEDAVLVGHFTRKDHLEALYFNRTNQNVNSTALLAIDLATGQTTFSSLHDGNIFGGWIDPTDEAFAAETNPDGYDDLVLVNRVPNPQAFERTDTGFIGMVSLHNLPDTPPGPYRGFYRFFAWNTAGSDGLSVFPGYDAVDNHATGAMVAINGQLTPVILLVNNSTQTGAAFAVLMPNPIADGSPDAFTLVSAVQHDDTNAGSFDANDSYLMADVNGDGSEAVVSYRRGGNGGTYLRVFDSITGTPINQVDPAFDSSFGNNGIVTTNFGKANQVANAVAVQTDGKIVVAGGTTDVFSTNDLTPTSDILLARYNADGSLDNTFGNGGKVITSFGQGPTAAHALVIDGNGRILVAGTFNNDFALARYNPNGTLDMTFGNGGMATESYKDPLLATGVKLQPDGKIVVGGFTNTGGNDDYAVARFNANGTLDAGFSGGLVVTNLTPNANNEAYALTIQNDGKIILAGFAGAPSETQTDRYGVVRYNTDGTLDDSFGNGGIVTTDYQPSGSDEGYSVLVQPDGKIVVGGGSFNRYDIFVLLRYNPDGSLDNSFGQGGIAATQIEPADSEINGIALMSDGRIVAAGAAAIDNLFPTFTNQFALARYNADGSLDTSFGSEGILVTSLGNGRTAGAFGVALQPDGSVVAVGNVNDGTGNNFAVARFLPG